jgi:hypothetical protein
LDCNSAGYKELRTDSMRRAESYIILEIYVYMVGMERSTFINNNTTTNLEAVPVLKYSCLQTDVSV